MFVTVLGKGVKASHILGIGFYRQVASILYLGECNCTYGKIYGLLLSERKKSSTILLGMHSSH